MKRERMTVGELGFLKEPGKISKEKETMVV